MRQKAALLLIAAAALLGVLLPVRANWIVALVTLPPTVMCLILNIIRDRSRRKKFPRRRGIEGEDGIRLCRVERKGAACYAIPEGTPFDGIRCSGEPSPPAKMRLLAPAGPSKVVCVGEDYPDHAKEFDSQVLQEPLIPLNPSSLLLAPRKRWSTSFWCSGSLWPGHRQAAPEREGRRLRRRSVGVCLCQRCHRTGYSDERRPVDPGKGI